MMLTPRMQERLPWLGGIALGFLLMQCMTTVTAARAAEWQWSVQTDSANSP